MRRLEWDQNYHYFRGLIKHSIYIETDPDELAEQIEKAYQENKLSSTKYADLCSMLAEAS